MLTSSPSACQPTACQPLYPSCVDATTCVPTALFPSHVAERGPEISSLSWKRYIGADDSTVQVLVVMIVVVVVKVMMVVLYY